MNFLDGRLDRLVGGVAVGRGTIVHAWWEGVQKRGEIVLLLVHQRRSDVSLKTTTSCLSWKKEAVKTIIQSACIVKVECRDNQSNLSIKASSVFQTKRVIVEKGEYVLLLAEGWYRTSYTINLLSRWVMWKGKQQCTFNGHNTMHIVLLYLDINTNYF